MKGESPEPRSCSALHHLAEESWGRLVPPPLTMSLLDQVILTESIFASIGCLAEYGDIFGHNRKKKCC